MQQKTLNDFNLWGFSVVLFYFYEFDLYIAISWNNLYRIANKNSIEIKLIIKNGIKIKLNNENKKLIINRKLFDSVSSLDF